jgi:hypothetical protein
MGSAADLAAYGPFARRSRWVRSVNRPAEPIVYPIPGALNVRLLLLRGNGVVPQDDHDIAGAQLNAL